MIKTELFTLEKIKELTSPIDDLEGKINQLNELSAHLNKTKLTLNQNVMDKEFSPELESLFKLIENLSNTIIKVTTENLKIFLNFKDNLIIKYKESFKYNLKKLKLQKEKTQLIGLSLLDNKKISKIVDKISYILAINLTEWVNLFDSLTQNTIFTNIIDKVKVFYSKILQERLNYQLDNLPHNIDPLLKNQFKKKFYENPELTYEKFLKNLENQLTQEEVKDRKAIRKKVKEKEEFEKLKKEQEEKKELYEEYLKLSQKEFERKRRKERRQKLKKIPETKKDTNTLKLSEEVTEKIEKFKSQFDQSFQEKYLVKKDDDLDPLEIIRKRKKKKEEEYREFKDHFDNIE